MSNTEKLQQELETLETRLNELSAERDQAGELLSAAREAVVEGTGKTPALIARESEHAALSGAVSELQRRIIAKRAMSASAKADDERNAKLDKLRAVAIAAHQDLAELDKATAEALAMLNALAPRVAAAFTAVFEKKTELETIARQLKDVPATLPTTSGATVNLEAIRGLSTGEIMLRMDKQPGAAPFSGFWQQAIQEALWQAHMAQVKNPKEAA